MKPGVKAFVVYQKKLLLILRDDDPTIAYPNTWNLPGGGVEDGETHEQALARELHEEISIVPRNSMFLGEQEYEDGNVVYRYLAKLTKDEFENIQLGKEGQKYQFFSLDELTHLQISKHSEAYINKYMIPLKQLLEKMN